MENNLPVKRYIGIASNEGLDNVMVHVINEHLGKADTSYVLPLHLEIFTHSPTGFAWGYLGSGPAQLALAIVYDYLCDIRGNAEIAKREALDIYQHFKSHTIARLNKDANFVLTSKVVAEAVERIEGLRPERTRSR